MIGSQLSADGNHVLGAYPKFRKFPLRFDIGLGEVTAHGTVRVLRLGLADTDLDSRVAILVSGPVRNNLVLVELQKNV